jgi:hypothetical protein
LKTPAVFVSVEAFIASSKVAVILAFFAFTIARGVTDATFGLAESTVHSRVTGALAFPGPPTALMENVCGPLEGFVRSTGEVHRR